MTFDALNLMAENNIKLIAINPRGQLTYTLEAPIGRMSDLKKHSMNCVKIIWGLKFQRN